jgi:hypothetical protein
MKEKGEETAMRVFPSVEGISQAVGDLNTNGTAAYWVQRLGNIELTSLEESNGNEIYVWQYD